MANFTIQEPLFLDLQYEIKEELEQIDAFIQLLDESGSFESIQNKGSSSNCIPIGRPGFDSRILLALVLFGFSQSDCSLRKLEEYCRFDLRFRYISSNQVPSYVTFCDFINRKILPNANDLIQRITSTIAEKMNVSILENVYIDGSKFEANANKYKFRFKSKRKRNNLYGKFNKLLEDLSIVHPMSALPSKMSLDMTNCLNEIKKQIEDSGKDVNEIKSGRGIRISTIDKAYLTGIKYLKKRKEYDEVDSICGANRNSYYLTDKDATARCLKEDYYSGLGSNRHAAYNVQYAVSNGLIIAIYVSQDRSDVRTFPPFLKKIKEMYGKYPDNVCADAGYGSAINYEFIKKEKIGNYVKFSSWKKEVHGEKPPKYRLVNDKLVCLDGRILIEKTNFIRKPRRSNHKFYEANCKGCQYKKYCNKGSKNIRAASKVFEIDIETLRSKEEARTNLLSVKGIELRINRSIQVEGSFGIMKQDKAYTRFRRRGLDKTDAEMILNCIGLNIAKYLRFVKTGKKPDYWKAPQSLQPEKERKISRTIKKGGKKIPKKQPNQIAKKSYKKHK